MPEKETFERARQDKREGKSPSTQAGEFVHEEIEHIREGKHGARSTKQAIAIGLSKARRAGVKLPPPEKGEALVRNAQAGQARPQEGQPREEEAVAGALAGGPQGAQEGRQAARPRRRRSRATPRRPRPAARRPTARAPPRRPRERAPRAEPAMIRKLASGEYRLYSRKKDPKTGKRRNLGTFKTRAAAEKHERAVQFFKRH